MRSALTLLLVAACSLEAQIASDPKDIVLKSMLDELERSRKLKIEGLEPPYFVQYTLDDAHSFSTSAALGATLGTSENRFRVPRVRVRVGDPSFDNTNYIFSDFGGNSRFDADQAPIDNDYRILRRNWWLATDRAYKGAVESIARKRAALKSVIQQETLPDLWPATAVQRLRQAETPGSDSGEWVNKVRSLSATFVKFPEIVSSAVSFTNTRSTYYLVNTEGTVLRRPEPLVHLQATASTFTPDGMTVRDTLSIPRIETESLPDQAALTKQINEVAENVRALARAPLGEPYSGPVLFEGIAGPQLIAELLAPNLVLSRKPVGEPGRSMPFLPSELENRLDSRVLPEFMDLVDDPLRSEWNGAALLGGFEIDEEGVLAKPLTVVEKGRLKAFLLTRQPVRGQKASNGRARLPGAFGAWQASVSNLFVNSSEAVKQADLRQRFLKLLTDRNKPWGLIVRKMDFPSGAGQEEARKLILAAQQAGLVRPVSAPVLAYKVFPDGREELIRGIRFRGLGLRSLRDIVAVSEEKYVLHYLNNGLPFALLSGGGYVAPASVVGPSLLFDDLEAERPQDDVPKPPVVPAPDLRTASRTVR